MNLPENYRPQDMYSVEELRNNSRWSLHDRFQIGKAYQAWQNNWRMTSRDRHWAKLLDFKTW